MVYNNRNWDINFDWGSSYSRIFYGVNKTTDFRNKLFWDPLFYIH